MQTAHLLCNEEFRLQIGTEMKGEFSFVARLKINQILGKPLISSFNSKNNRLFESKLEHFNVSYPTVQFIQAIDGKCSATSLLTKLFAC